MTNLILLENNKKPPEVLIREQCETLKSGDKKTRCVFIPFTFKTYWLKGQPEEQLCAFVEIIYQEQNDCRIRFTVTDQECDLTAYLMSLPAGDTIDFLAVCRLFSLPSFFLDEPLSLTSIHIPKPWGQEVWFTGIEERGVALVQSQGLTAPLPWVLATFPEALCNALHQSLVLLKILDPLPQPVFGDLYFELHQEKREVYVVTAVDKAAWPEGEGEIRFGINQEKRQQYATDSLFKAAFIKAIKAYETVRRQIDELLDKRKEEHSIAVNSSVEHNVLLQWLQDIPQSLSDQEQQLRVQMESFTQKRALKVGDVLKVPCLTPHSLQHGVRTVEFQTPVYERLIVSFAQKVLTQDYWDTTKAVELMMLDSDHQAEFDCLLDRKGVFIERIVDFEDFDVRRVVLQGGSQWFFEAPTHYSLCMGIEGEVSMGSITLLSEQAVLLPKAWEGYWIDNDTTMPVSFLVANPK